MEQKTKYGQTKWNVKKTKILLSKHDSNITPTVFGGWCRKKDQTLPKGIKMEKNFRHRERGFKYISYTYITFKRFKQFLSHTMGVTRAHIAHSCPDLEATYCHTVRRRRETTSYLRWKAGQRRQLPPWLTTSPGAGPWTGKIPESTSCHWSWKSW